MSCDHGLYTVPVSYTDEETRLQRRAERITGWLLLFEEMYGNLVSRSEETASVPGFDDTPRRRPCEHRRQWMRGQLCLACENTGWRPCARGEEGVDPYATDVKRGVVIVESTSRRKAREAQHIDNIIAGLERDARLREGAEVREGPMDRFVRVVGRKDGTLKRILATIARLRLAGVEHIDAHLLAVEVPGPIREP